MKKFKKVWSRFKYIIIGYIFVIVLAVLSTLFKSQLENHLNGDFLTSFNASIIEDIIFFGIIGVIGIYITIKPYNEEDFSVRVKSLANNDKLKDDAIEYLKTEVKKLVAYTEDSNITLILEEIDSSKKLLLIHTTIENKIRNMCNDIDFIFSDSTFYIKPDKSVGDDFGYVSFMGIQDEKNQKNKVMYFKNNVHRFKNNNEFSRPINDFGIDKGSSALWKLAFGIWIEIDKNTSAHDEVNWYSLIMNRYTDSTNLTIINKTSHEMSAEVKYFSDEPEKSVDIQIGGKDVKKEIIKNMSFYKNDEIKIKFRINE